MLDFDVPTDGRWSVRTSSSMVLAALVAASMACSSTGGSTPPEPAAPAIDAGSTSTDSGPSTDAGATPLEDSSADSGTSTPIVLPLPATTFLFARHDGTGHDQLVAHDPATGAERVVTTLKDAAGKGSDLAGFAISRSRTRAGATRPT